MGERDGNVTAHVRALESLHVCDGDGAPAVFAVNLYGYDEALDIEPIPARYSIRTIVHYTVPVPDDVVSRVSEYPV